MTRLLRIKCGHCKKVAGWITREGLIGDDIDVIFVSRIQDLDGAPRLTTVLDQHLLDDPRYLPRRVEALTQLVDSFRATEVQFDEWRDTAFIVERVSGVCRCSRYLSLASRDVALAMDKAERSGKVETVVATAETFDEMCENDDRRSARRRASFERPDEAPDVPNMATNPLPSSFAE